MIVRAVIKVMDQIIVAFTKAIVPTGNVHIVIGASGLLWFLSLPPWLFMY